MTKKNSVFFMTLMFAVAVALTACSKSDKSTHETTIKTTQAATNKNVATNKFEKSPELCANTFEIMQQCKEGGWDGTRVMAASFYGDTSEAIQRGVALSHLYENNKYGVIKNIFDDADGTCKSIIKIGGQYNGSDYSATLYCDKTNILELRLKYMREQAAK